MPHGGYVKRKVTERRPRSKSLSIAKKPKSISLKNQIRSIERLLRRDLPISVKDAHEKRLVELKRQQEIHTRLDVQREIFLRDKRIKFFERRKIERGIRRFEKQQRSLSGQTLDEEVGEQLSKLKDDLEYVRFFPKNEKYVSLFIGDSMDVVERRNRLRKQIKANLVSARASGKDLETGSEDDGLLDLSEDDYFLTGSSSFLADADDELTDRSARGQVSSTSGKATSMSSDERNQRQISARALMPPPRPSTSSYPSHAQRKFGYSAISNPSRKSVEIFASSNTSGSRRSSQNRGSSNSLAGQSSNLSCNSDAYKPRRKRRPKKKKQV